MSEESNILPDVTQNQMHTPKDPIWSCSHHSQVPQQVPERHVSEPKKQRSPRRRKTRSDWQLNQRQYEQNRHRKYHISYHKSPLYLKYSTWEKGQVSPTCNCQQETNFSMKTTDCTRCGKTGHLKCFCTGFVQGQPNCIQ